MTGEPYYLGDDIARLAAWDQTHAKALRWLHRCTQGMYHPVRVNGPALACAELYEELCRANVPIDALRKSVALALVELARRDVEAEVTV